MCVICNHNQFSRFVPNIHVCLQFQLIMVLVSKSVIELLYMRYDHKGYYFKYFRFSGSVMHDISSSCSMLRLII